MYKFTVSLWSIILLTCVLSLGSVCAWDSIYDLTAEEKADVNVKLRTALSSVFIGNIHVGGIIVDEQSNALHNVSIDVHLNQYGVARSTTNLSEVFQFDFTNATSLTLCFTKDGFYDRRISLSVPDALPNGDGLRVVSNVNEVVVLTAIGAVAVLEERSGFVEFAVSNSCWGLRVDGVKAERYEIHTPTNSASIVTNSFYVSAVHDGRAIAMTNLPSGLIVPELVNLHLASSGGGFVQYTVDESGESENIIFRRMKVAPEEGYSNELALPSGKDVFFYFKMGGTYGKGMLPAVLRQTDTDVRVVLDLYLQRDGSRNVTSPQ